MNDLTDFENCLALGKDYNLLPNSNGGSFLSVSGPMNREEAIAFFYRCRLNTFPLYMREHEGEYYAFY